VESSIKARLINPAVNQPLLKGEGRRNQLHGVLTGYRVVTHGVKRRKKVKKEKKTKRK
jgi:hypothetical protein